MEFFQYGRNRAGFTKIWAFKFFEKLFGKTDANINLSVIFAVLSKSIGVVFFSIAYIQHSYVL